MVEAVCRHLASTRGDTHAPKLSSLELFLTYPILNPGDLCAAQLLVARRFLERLVKQRSGVQSQAGERGTLRKLVIDSGLVPNAVDLGQYVKNFTVVSEFDHNMSAYEE